MPSQNQLKNNLILNLAQPNSTLDYQPLPVSLYVEEAEFDQRANHGTRRGFSGECVAMNREMFTNVGLEEKFISIKSTNFVLPFADLSFFLEQTERKIVFNSEAVVTSFADIDVEPFPVGQFLL